MCSGFSVVREPPTSGIPVSGDRVARKTVGTNIHALLLLLLLSPSSCGRAGPRLEEWSILRLWFAGRFFESPAQLAHAWQHDVKGLRSNFEWEAPGGWRSG